VLSHICSRRGAATGSVVVVKTNRYLSSLFIMQDFHCYPEGKSPYSLNITVTNCIQNLISILVPSLTPYVDEIVGDQLCGFRRNRSITDHIPCFRQISVEK
jgi:hypothetical protein